MLDIYKYLDYRMYLKDYFAESKKTCKAFSHQFFAVKAGIKSSGFMLHVIKGQRNLTLPVLLKVAKATNMDNDQTEYFEVLVAFNQAKNQRDKEYYLQKILEKRRIAKTLRLEDKQVEFYKEWRHAAVRELVNVAGKDADASQMAKLLIPSVSPAKVRESFTLLEELGLIRKTIDNHYEITHQYIEGDDPALKTAIVRFQRSMLDLAAQSWDNCLPGEASAHTLTIGVSEKLAGEIKADMEQCKKKIVEKILSEKDPAQRVYQVTMNFFPLSKKKKGELQ
jgi:uncharacterized protein (TIGR02147 family)